MVADQGDATAQYNIGVLLVADYLGATKCSGARQQEASIQAYKWFTAASEQGYGDAVVARRILSEQMTPAQIAEAEILAREWQFNSSLSARTPTSETSPSTDESE